MASKQLLPTTTTTTTTLLLLLLHLTVNFPASTVAQCPYPCYPPPIGNTPPVTTMPPPATTMPPPSQTKNYPPPAAIYTPPSGGVYPYTPQTPTFYGGAPPPPDPIVPWFPYYYKDPPRNPHKSSAVDLRIRSTVVIFLVHVLVFRLLLS